MNEVCTDNRFEIIEKAKKQILESTNISSSTDEMKVLDSFLFRCWQMGWLDKYTPRDDGIYFETFAVKEGVRYNNKVTSVKAAAATLTNSLMDGMEKLWA